MGNEIAEAIRELTAVMEDILKELHAMRRQLERK